MAAPILLAILAVLLLVAAATDIRARVISNRLNAAIALLAPLYWLASGLDPWPGMAMQAGLALGVFALFAGLFAAGLMGGGDVKMLTALALWLPLAATIKVLIATALLGGVVTVIVLAWHRLRRLSAAPEVPYGVAIAGAGLWAVSELYLNHFA